MITNARDLSQNNPLFCLTLPLLSLPKRGVFGEVCKVSSWKYADIGQGRYGFRRIIFGKVALAMYFNSEEVTLDRLAHNAATLSQGQGEVASR